MRVHLVCNPASGGSTSEDSVSASLELNGATMTEAHDAERIVVSGGDGTVALGAALAAEHRVPLAVVPTGTANDFARANDLPLDEDLAAAFAVRAGTASLVAHELGRMDGRPFVNVASAGLAPAAARRAAPFKRLLGPLAYPLGALISGAVDSPVRVRAEEHFEGAAWQVIVAVTGAFGGGSEIDAADPHDGRLDLVVVPAGPRVKLALHALAMRRGDLADAFDVTHARLRELTLAVPAGTSFNVDGELVDAGPEVSFTVEAAAFELVTGVR